MADLLLNFANYPILDVMPMGGAQIAALVLAVLALAISGFVSGSEIAYFSLTPTQCEELEETSKGERILAMLEKPERLLATILIANNLVNVTIVVLCNFALGPIFSGMPTPTISDGQKWLRDLSICALRCSTPYRQYWSRVAE